ncbi:MAG: hypothetical protein EHM79_01225 [Geobacter sp.]|nr:MAG: hypothetical protein EHM79_01225 [Geobacter sp.]
MASGVKPADHFSQGALVVSDNERQVDAPRDLKLPRIRPRAIAAYGASAHPPVVPSRRQCRQGREGRRRRYGFGVDLGRAKTRIEVSLDLVADCPQDVRPVKCRREAASSAAVGR